MVGKQQLTMLITSGSMHNFLDVQKVKVLGCKVIPINSHSMVVAGGGQLQCDSICPQFHVELNGVSFCSDIHLLSLGGCDLVLGMQWL